MAALYHTCITFSQEYQIKKLGRYIIIYQRFVHFYIKSQSTYFIHRLNIAHTYYTYTFIYEDQVVYARYVNTYMTITWQMVDLVVGTIQYTYTFPLLMNSFQNGLYTLYQLAKVTYIHTSQVLVSSKLHALYIIK